jgi:hypothetical protein
MRVLGESMMGTSACMFSSNSPPDTSFTMCAPAAIAERATSAWKVSTAMSTSRKASSVASALQTRQ